MNKYQPLLIEKMGGANMHFPLYDTSKEFNIWVQRINYDILSDAKEIPQNNWFDEHGVDEYIPTEGLYLREAQMEVFFICKGEKETTALKARRFLEYIIGLDGSGAFMKLYATNLGFGVKDARYLSAKDFTIDLDGDEEILTFKVTFQVNDPITKIVRGQGILSNRLLEG